MPTPPDFDLAPLLALPRELFKTDDREVDAFVLSMALAFNDLKVIEWTHLQMHHFKTEMLTVDPVQGQIRGMGI